MVVEWLRVRVPTPWQEPYLEADARIWTPVLATQPGFLGKQVWLEPSQPEELILVIHWASLVQWKAIPGEILQATEAHFVAVVGQSFSLLESRVFEVQG